MVHGVKRRLTRPLVYLLVAVQLLLSAPMASAQAVKAIAEAVHSADVDSSGSHDSENCPCCPDDVTTSLDCLAACAPAATFPVVMPALAVKSSVLPVVPPAPLIYLPLADPPLKPPPIV